MRHYTLTSNVNQQENSNTDESTTTKQEGKDDKDVQQGVKDDEHSQQGIKDNKIGNDLARESVAGKDVVDNSLLSNSTTTDNDVTDEGIEEDFTDLFQPENDINDYSSSIDL